MLRNSRVLVARTLAAHFYRPEFSEPLLSSPFNEAFDKAVHKPRNFSSGGTPSNEVLGAASQFLDPSTIVDVAQAASHAAVVAEASQRWPIIAGVQYAMEWLHLTTGSPWWLTIAVTTVLFRVATFPVALYQIKNTYRMSVGVGAINKGGQARPESEMLVNEYQAKMASGMDVNEARNWYTTQLAGVWQKYNCNPMKSFATLAANGTLFISFFMALRGLSDARVPSMTSGGIGWFADLTLADPHYALPVISSLVFLGTIELGAADGMQGQPEKMVNRMKWFMRFLAVAIVPFTLTLPCSVFVYWITSNTFSLAQTKILKNPRVKSALGVPDLEVKNPTKVEVGKPVMTFQYNPTKSKKKRKQFQ